MQLEMSHTVSLHMRRRHMGESGEAFSAVMAGLARFYAAAHGLCSLTSVVMHSWTSFLSIRVQHCAALMGLSINRIFGFIKYLSLPALEFPSPTLRTLNIIAGKNEHHFLKDHQLQRLGTGSVKGMSLSHISYGIFVPHVAGRLGDVMAFGDTPTGAAAEVARRIDGRFAAGVLAVRQLQESRAQVVHIVF